MRVLKYGRINDVPSSHYPSQDVDRVISVMWLNMFERVFNDKREGYQYWKDSKIHESLYLKSNFVKWIESEPLYDELVKNPKAGWCIDKDSKCPGNKNYYPEYMTLMLKSDNVKERNSRKGNPSLQIRKPIIGIPLDNKNFKIVFPYVNWYAKFLGEFSDYSITKCAKGLKDSYKGYKWYYLEVIKL